VNDKKSPAGVPVGDFVFTGFSGFYLIFECLFLRN